MSLPASHWILLRPDGSACCLRLARATAFADRLRGLIGRPLPAPGQGLWIEPCNAVHSLAMRAPIDVVFVDRARCVLAVESALAPWRATACRRAHSTIELQAGEAGRLRIEPGAVLVEAGTPLFVDDRTPVGLPPCQKEPAMAQQIESSKIHRPRAGRTRAAAAAAAVTLVSGCAAPEVGVVGASGSSDPAERPTAVASREAPTAPTEDAPSAAVATAVAERRAEAQPIERLAEAEALYRSSRFDDALPAFRSIVEADPAHAHAWLRIGNILHRRREWFDALSAYRKAARPQADPAIREKAVYNVALLNLELARQAMKRLERIRSEQGAVDGRAAAPRGAGVSDGALRHLSDEVAVSYRALSERRAAAPEPGPRSPASAPASLPAEKPVEVEIRQGGGGR